MSNINTALKLVINLTRLEAMLSRRFNGLSLHGIGLTDFMILHLLREAPGEKMRRIDLAEKVGLTASGVTRMLLPMEKRGLVKRESSPWDARVSLVVLSSAGRRLYADATATANGVAEQIFPAGAELNLTIIEIYQKLGIATI